MLPLVAFGVVVVVGVLLLVVRRWRDGSPGRDGDDGQTMIFADGSAGSQPDSSDSGSHHDDGGGWGSDDGGDAAGGGDSGADGGGGDSGGDGGGGDGGGGGSD